MSRRFGRNQKREFRQQIEDLNNKEFLNNELIKRQSKLIQKLENEINRAKEIAGRMSILFDPKIKELIEENDIDREFIRVVLDSEKSASSFFYDPEKTYNLYDRNKELPILIAKVNKDVLRNAVHVKVSYGNDRLTYAIDKRSLSLMPRNVAIEIITNNLASQLVTEFREILGNEQ